MHEVNYSDEQIRIDDAWGIVRRSKTSTTESVLK